MTDHMQTSRSFLTPRWQWVSVLILVALSIVLAAVLVSANSSSRNSPGFVSAEVHFTDASAHGLSIVPASCPSSPDYPGQCDTPPIVNRCPDGSPAQNNDTSRCTCAQGNTSQCLGGGNPNGNPSCTAGQFSEGSRCVAQCDVGYVQQGNTCIFNACPSGYVFQGGQCVVSTCPVGYFLQNGSCVANECSPHYVCSANSLYYQDESCTQSLIQACAYGCSAGACLGAPASFATISASPALLQEGEATQVSWSAQNVVVGSCSVSGSNGDVWSGADGVKTSSPIEAQTTYTLSCTGLDSSAITKQVTVGVVPVFNEH
jgi:hypothetical protein